MASTVRSPPIIPLFHKTSIPLHSINNLPIDLPIDSLGLSIPSAYRFTYPSIPINSHLPSTHLPTISNHPPEMSSTNSIDLENFKPGPLKRVWTVHIAPIKSQYKPIYGRPLGLAIFALQFANMMTFLDSMATPLLMPTLAADLNASSTIV